MNKVFSHEEMGCSFSETVPKPPLYHTEYQNKVVQFGSFFAE